MKEERVMGHKPPDSLFVCPLPPREILDSMEKAYGETLRHLDQHPGLRKNLSSLWFTCYHVLDAAAPSDLDTLTKIGFLPFSEATNEMIYAVNFALMGVYKTAFEKLRSFFELHLVGLYFADPSVAREGARKWVLGRASTPFMRTILKALFERPYFLRAERAFSFREDLATAYSELCDYVHTRGLPRSHGKLSGCNLPRFSAETLGAFVEALGRTAECVAIALALQFPVILQPLPISDKFGLNPPSSGFLEEGQVRLLEELIAPEKLSVLRDISAKDPRVQKIAEAIRGRPDLTPEELDQQILEWNKRLIETSGLEKWLENQRSILAQAPESGKARIAAMIEELTAWARQRGLDKHATRPPAAGKHDSGGEE